MPLEVLNEHLVHAVRCRWVAAGVSHRASTAVEILPHYHRNFPQSRIGSRGTGRYHAVVEELVIQRVRPAGRPVLIDRHRGVIREVRVPEHLEHVVAADLRATVAPHVYRASSHRPGSYSSHISESIDTSRRRNRETALHVHLIVYLRRSFTWYNALDKIMIGKKRSLKPCQNL